MSWSVIIPTLWKPATFPTLLRNLDTCDAVSEIVLVDNAPSAKPEGLTTDETGAFASRGEHLREFGLLGVQHATSEDLHLQRRRSLR